jgi:hypothetical protein
MSATKLTTDAVRRILAGETPLFLQVTYLGQQGQISNKTPGC